MKVFLTKIVTCLVFVFAIWATFSACNTNLCQNIACKNNGTCREGACACPSGYEGAFCENALSEKFVGTWEGQIRCNGGLPTYLRYICVPGNNPKELILYTLENQSLKLIANVTEADSKRFEIAKQSIYVDKGLGDFEKYTFEGRGYVEKEDLVYLYLDKTIEFKKGDSIGTNNSTCKLDGSIIKIP